MLADQPSQGPVQGGASDLLAQCHRVGQVLTPHMPTGLTAVAAVPGDQDRRTPAERCVADPAGYRVPRRTLGSAVFAPWVWGRDLTEDLSGGGGDVLTDGRETEGIQAGGSRQVRGAEDRIIHCPGFVRIVV